MGNKKGLNQKVYLGDQFIVTDWKNARPLPPENLQEKIKKQVGAGTKSEKDKSTYLSAGFITTG